MLYRTVFYKQNLLLSSQTKNLSNALVFSSCRLEDNIDSSIFHIEQGQETLQDIYASMRGNRMLIIKLFLILMFFIAFFVFFMA